MKLLLFLDDWFLDAHANIVRRFPRAAGVPVADAHLFSRLSIIRDERGKCFAGMGKGPVRYASSDGIRWKKEKAKPRFRFEGAPKNGKKVPIPEGFPFEQGWFYDKWDNEVSRRYKMLLWPYADGKNGGPGLVACSPDGRDWRINPGYKWFSYPAGSDTTNNMFYNPFSGKWNVICRRRNNDRRVALVESEDLEHWSEPRVIIHPDVLDTPFLQFYGMAAMLYENEYFIGALQCHNVPVNEIDRWSKGRVKMQGTVDAQLTYSYNGETWLRGDRTPLIERAELGSYGCAGRYPIAILEAPENKIYIYSIATLQDHGVTSIPKGYVSNEALTLHVLRRDGFSFLEPVGGWGEVATRVLIPRSGGITVNYQAPCGQIQVQITDSEHKVVPGYSFNDCVPLHGDEVLGCVRWKKHADLSRLTGRPVRIEFRLFDARLYAVRLHCDFWYGYWPETKMSRV